MSSRRLKARVAGASLVGTYALKGHRLKFHKAGKDGSAKCDALFTGSDTDIVEGVVYDLHPTEVPLLDHAEGLGKGYRKKHVRVSKGTGKLLVAFAYIALEIDDALLPFSWYKHHVLSGAREAKLRTDYQRQIACIKSIRDPDRAREIRELAVHSPNPSAWGAPANR